MRIRLLASTTGPTPTYQFAMSYLINDCVAIDAGAIGFAPLTVQRAIQHVFLSHVHLDHIASLPIFLDNVYQPGPEAVSLYAGQPTWEALQLHVFNDVVWPDFIRLSAAESPFFHFQPLLPETTVSAAGLTIHPVPLDHVVSTLGFIIDDGLAAVAIVSDTSPTHRIWEVARTIPHLKAVFLESSFPSSLQWLADKTNHLTATTFASELAKSGLRVPFYAMHIKPAFQEIIVGELQRHGLDNLHILEPDRDYDF